VGLLPIPTTDLGVAVPRTAGLLKHPPKVRNYYLPKPPEARPP
jgi:hypothetical protein